ncbi:MAG TPA: type II toxin-antitoxin system HipA family toxin, partial [Opitutaceae bacterium]
MAKLSAPALSVKWYDGRLVGKVVNPGDTYFAYADEWLANGYNLSPLRVPFSNKLYKERSKHFDHLPGFLSDALPDQWGRRLMEREFRDLDLTPTPIRMLSWVGARGIGALTFSPALDESPPDVWQKVSPLLLTREAQSVMRHDPAQSFTHLKNAGTAGGALPKTTIGLLPDGGILIGSNVANMVNEPGARLGLLKLDFEDDPLKPKTDGRMEKAYLEMARSAGINTVNSEVLVDTADIRPRHHLFVERFDCAAQSAHRLHVVTLAGLLQSFDLTYSHLLQTTRDLTRDHRQLREAVRRMIFNVRSGNADDHGKNHSFVFDDRTGDWTLSPAYDLTLNYSPENTYTGLFSSTFGARPRCRALARVAGDFGILPKEFDEIDEEVALAIGQWNEIAGKVGLPAQEIERAYR